MTDDQFKYQIQRLESTFGEKHFDLERLDLIKAKVMWMELGEFAQIVSHFISTFRTAPLPKDFAEAARTYRNNRMDQARSTPTIFRPEFTSGSLEKTLKEKYPKAKNLTEAIEIERNKIRLKRGL